MPCLPRVRVHVQYEYSTATLQVCASNLAGPARVSQQNRDCAQRLILAQQEKAPSRVE